MNIGAVESEFADAKLQALTYFRVISCRSNVEWAVEQLRRIQCYSSPDVGKTTGEVKAMRLGRAIAGISAIICVVGLTAIGQEEGSDHKTAPNPQLERCKTAMPIILKNYNNAKYAVLRAGESADAAHILGPMREAQAALDAMEQPLKACADAMQNTPAEHQQDLKK